MAPDENAGAPLDTEQSNIGQTVDRGEQFEQAISRPNWSASDRFKEAHEAVESFLMMDTNYKDSRKAAVNRALCLTMSLIEDWRGEHREEINEYLVQGAPKEGEDEVLPIVKCVFGHESKKQWTWRGNAIRWALKIGKTAADAEAFFTTTAPTRAAKLWTNTHSEPASHGSSDAAVTEGSVEAADEAAVEVPITCDLSLPDGEAFPWPEPEERKAFLVCTRADGTHCFVIFQPKKVSDEKSQPRRRGRSPTGETAASAA